jgi:hypothetical protein
MEVEFTSSSIPLERVRSFKHLGRILTDTTSHWPSLHHNPQKARRRWALVSWTLDEEGASVRAWGMFHKSVMQAIICETWTVTGAMLKVLDSIHHCIAQCITGKMGRRSPDGEWVHPTQQEALQEAGSHSMQEHIRHQQRMVEQCIAVRPIHTLCREASPRTGSSRFLRWWDFTLLDSFERALVFSVFVNAGNPLD